MKINYILFVLILLSCSPKNIVSDNSSRTSDTLFTKFNCETLKELELSSRQKSRLNKGMLKLFGIKRDLSNFCFIKKYSKNQFSLVNGFNFSAHQTNIYLIVNERDNDLYVLQSEDEELSIIDSYEKHLKDLPYTFPNESLVGIREAIQKLMKDT